MKTIRVKLFGFRSQGEYTGSFGDVVRGVLHQDRVAELLDQMEQVGRVAGDEPIISVDLVADEETTLRLFFADGELGWSSKDIDLPAYTPPEEAALAFIVQAEGIEPSGSAHRAGAWEQPLPSLTPPASANDNSQEDVETDETQPAEAAEEKPEDVKTYATRAVAYLKKPASGSFFENTAKEVDASTATVVASLRPRIVSASASALLATAMIVGGGGGMFLFKPTNDRWMVILVAASIAAAGVWFGWVTRRWFSRYAIAIDKPNGQLFALVDKEVRAAVRLDEIEQIASRPTELAIAAKSSAYGASTTVRVDGGSLWLVLRGRVAVVVFKIAGCEAERLANKANKALGLTSSDDWYKGRLRLGEVDWDSRRRFDKVK